MLRAGKLRTDAEEEEREKSGEKGRMSSSPDWKRNDAEKKMTEALEKIAAEHGTKNIRASESQNSDTLASLMSD